MLECPAWYRQTTTKSSNGHDSTITAQDFCRELTEEVYAALLFTLKTEHVIVLVRRETFLAFIILVAYTMFQSDCQNHFDHIINLVSNKSNH